MANPPPGPQTPISSIRLRGQTKKRLAARLLQIHLSGASAASSASTADAADAARRAAGPLPPVRVVCVADTHNTRPVLPPGDVLIHAGDLTDEGSFAEVQAGLAWLAAQPHRHKVLVAGNHDVLLDPAFLAQHPERRYGAGPAETAAHLQWGDVVYLEDRAVTVAVGARSLTVYGAPWTPAYGVSAFQYRPDAAEQLWSDRLGGFAPGAPGAPDILVTHGPPKLHRDQRDWYRAGCAHLAEQVARLRPRLCVFGHIHAAYGREDAVVDAVRWQHDQLVIGWASWAGLARMAALVVWAKVAAVLRRVLWRPPQPHKVTTFVNAAVVGGPNNELQNAPIVVEI